MSTEGQLQAGPFPRGACWSDLGMAMCSLLRQSLFWERRPEKRDTRSLHPFYLVFSIPTKEFDSGPKGNRLVSEARLYTPASSECPALPLKLQVLSLHACGTAVSDARAPDCGLVSSSLGDLYAHQSWRPLGLNIRSNPGAGNLGTCHITWPRVACRPVGPPLQTAGNSKLP